MAQYDGSIVIGTSINEDGFEKGAEDVVAACRRVASTIEEISEKQRLALEGSINDFAKQNEAYAQQEEKVKRLAAELDKLRNTKVETDAYKAVNGEIEKLEKRFDELVDKQERFVSTGGNTNSAAFKRMDYDLEGIIQKLNQAKAKKRELESSGGAYQAADTGKAESDLSIAQAKLSQMGTSLDTNYKRLKQRMAELSGGTGRLSAAASGAGTAVKGLASKLGGVLKKGLSGIVGLTKKAAAGLLHMGKSAKTANGGLNTSLKTLIRYGIGVEGMLALVNKLRRALVDGLGNLAKYSDRTNASISGMMSSITRLKNSAAAAFAPILNIVAPVVTKLTNLLSTGISYIGAFFAALSGQSTYTRAIAVQEDYAASLEDSASAAKDAAKETKGYLSGLDEVRKFDDGSGAGVGGSGGGGGSGGASGPMFEEAEIPGFAANWVDKIKSAWKDADFSEIGTIVGAKLRNALEKIPWSGIQSTCNRVATSIATFINGFVATPGLWVELGNTIGNGINTAVGMWNTFFDTTNFVNIGIAIATMLATAIATTDFYGLGRALSQKLRSTFDMLYGFVTTFNWSGLGKKIADMIRGAISNIDPATVGGAFVGLVNGLVATLLAFIQNTPWSDVTSKIAGAINYAISNIKWSDLGASIGGVVKLILKLLVEFFTNVNWREFGRGIGKLINGALKSVSIKDFMEAASAVVKALVDAVVGAIFEIDWGYAIGVFLDGIKDTFDEIAPGFFKSDFSFAKDMSAYMGGAGRDSSVRFVHQFDSVPKQVGEKFNESYSAATNAWSGTSTDFNTISGEATGAFDSFLSSVPDTFETAYDSAKGTWSNAAADYSQIANDVSGGFSNLPTGVSDQFSGAYSGAKNQWQAVGDDFKKISNSAAAAFGEFGKGVQKTFSQACKAAKKEWSSAKTDFTKIASNAVSGFSSVPGGISAKFKSALTQAKNAWSSAKSGFSSIAANVVNSFSTLPGSIRQKFQTAYQNAVSAWSSAGSRFSGIANSISGAFASVPGRIQAYFSSAINFVLNAGWPSVGSRVMSGILSGMYATNGLRAWSNWFTSWVQASASAGNTGYYLTQGIIRGMYTTSGLGNWAKWFVTSVKRSLGIHSPSTVFRDEVGYFLGAGIGEGMEASENGLLKTVRNMADAIIDGFNGAVSKLDLRIPVTADSVLPNIQIPTPVVATGTVIPPKAAYSANDTQEIKDTLSGLSGLISRLTGGGMQQPSRNDQYRFTLTMPDGRVLFDIVKNQADLIRSQSGRNPLLD